MAVQFLNNIDLNNNQILNVRLQNLGSDPAGAGAGAIYFSTAAGVNRPKWTDGTSWYQIYPFSTSLDGTAVLRDATGNFSAGTITAALNGNAATASALNPGAAISISGKATAAGVTFTGAGNIALNITALTVAVGDIGLTNGSFIVGNGSNVGSAVAKSGIPLSGFGVPTAEVSFGGQKITNLATPTAGDDASTAATKGYVDAVAQGLDVKASVRYATAAALPSSTFSSSPDGSATLTATANGELSVDGSSLLSIGDRILVKNQAAALQNGIYTVTAPGSAGYSVWVLTRATDFNTSAEASPGSFTFVEQGTVNGDTGWVMTTDAPVTLNTSAIAWTQFSGAGSITQGKGIVVDGNTVHFAQSSNYTANTIPYANSINTIGFTSAPTGGQLLIGNATNVPTFTSMSGDATLSNAGALTISSNAVTYAKFQQVAALSIVGNASNATANAAAITAGSDHQVLRRSGTSIGFGAINLASTNAVTGTLPPGNGGTGSQFFQVSGPAAVRTYTFNNFDCRIPALHTATITGDGATASFQVTHNFGSRDVSVAVYQVASPYAQIFTDVEAETLNRVVVRFASNVPNATAYRVVIVGFGPDTGGS